MQDCGESAYEGTVSLFRKSPISVVRPLHCGVFIGSVLARGVVKGQRVYFWLRFTRDSEPRTPVVSD